MNNADEQAGQDIPLPNTEYDLRKQTAELIIANKELAFQNEEKAKRAAELIIANKELAFQNEEKAKRAAELIIANKELAFQNEEKEKRAAELIIANKELAFQNEEKAKRAAELITAQELALQAAEKYRIVADFTYDWEIWQDPGGALLYVSPSCERITGYKAAEFIADPGLILQITHPDDQAKVREHLHEDQEKESMELDFRIITLDGGIRWIDHVCTGVYNKDGQFLGRRASNRDVTGRKRLEEELQQISTRLSMAVRAGGVGIWDYDVSHNTLIWDDQMFRLYGITAAQFSGDYEAWTAGVHPEDRARGDEEIKMALRGEKEFDTEFRVLWPDGSTHYIRAMASVQRNAAGQGVRLVGTNSDITGHRLAEAMLEKSRLRLENIIEATHIGTWEWNVQTGETVFNEAWAEIIGYTLDELAPVSIKTWEKFAHPDDMKQSMLLLERHFAGELPYYDYECRMKHKNGHWVWVHDRGRVVTRTADGKPLLMFGNHTELIKSNAYLENLINCANAPIIVWDSQFHITRFNHAFELLTGRSEAEVLGQLLDILFPPALVQKTTAMISRTAAGERWEAVEIEIMHRNGTTRTVLWNSATLFAPDDKTPIATIAQGQDITASKLMKKALIESEARYKLIAENAFDLIALADSNGRYVYCNHSYLDILGYSPDAMIGRNCFDIVHPEDKEKAIQIFQKCLAEKILEEKLSIRLLCNNGAIKWVDHRARIIVDESSNSMHILLNAMDITESKLADEALRQNQLRFEQLAAQSRTIIWEVNADGLYTYVSPMIEQILGYLQIEITGKKYFYELHPEDGREEFKTAAFAIFKRKEQFLNLENRLKTMDGNFIWVSTNGIPILDADGKLLGYRGSDTDITEHKLTEEALQETKDYLDNLFNHANAPIIVWDSKFRITQFNNAFEKLSGLNVSDVLGKQVDILFPAETREHSIECIKLTTGGDRWGEVEMQIQHIDGSLRTLLWNSATIYSTDGRTVIGTIAQGYDITKRKQAELNRDQLLLFTTALNKIAEVIISQENAEYILENANRIIGETMQVDRLLIYDVSFEQNCITGLCEWLRCDHPDIAPTKAQYPLDMFLSPFTEIMNTRKYLKSYSGAVDEHFIEDGSGKILHEKLKIKSLLWYPCDFNEHGYYVFTLNQIIEARQWTQLELDFLESVAKQVSLALMKIRMIEQRNKTGIELISAKEHAEESDRLKTAFLNNISHEIRTPFNCILGFLAILDDDTLSRDERNEYTGMINQAAERLMNAINDIVEMSKIQTGQVKITLVETDINKLAREVSERFELQARIKNLTFTVKNSLAASACSIKTDDDKLNSVLGILINNAIKFTKAGSIELTVQKNENGLEFSVKDTGTGIPEDKRYRIFKQFMQADVSNTRKFEGSGLGLSIAKAYVEMLGGSIDFESQVDKGTTFYFTIPDANTDAKAHGIPGTPAKMEPVRLSLKILVTEDDEVNFAYINAVLTRAGYEVLYARTGAEAVEICRDNMDIGTIFMDIKMPVMDGYIATREIRKFNPSVPIIAITAYAETGDRKRCLDAGMNDFASKPVTPRDMMEVLDKWLSRDNPR